MTVDKADIAKSTSVFVIVGLFQGMLLIAVDYMSFAFHPDLAAGIILLALVLSNGGFHLDGLADTFDALAVKPSGDVNADKEKRLSVMKDASIGAIGAIAIIFSIGIKYLAIRNLSHFTYFTYYSSLLLMPVLSKWTMVISMFHGSPARKDGLGQIFIGRIGFRETLISTFTLIAFFTLTLVLFSRYMPDMHYAFYVSLIIVLYIFCRLAVSLFNKRFGGLTGDTLGAISEVTEIIFLLMVIVWSRLSI
jgi:adenosylcobinamide-GDP ribazoletransferase